MSNQPMLYFLRYKKGMRKPVSMTIGPVEWRKGYFGPGSRPYMLQLAAKVGATVISEEQFAKDLSEMDPDHYPDADLAKYFLWKWGHVTIAEIKDQIHEDYVEAAQEVFTKLQEGMVPGLPITAQDLLEMTTKIHE